MPAAEAKGKTRTVVYLPDDLRSRLKHEKADTDIPVTIRIERIIRDHYSREDRAHKHGQAV